MINKALKSLFIFLLFLFLSGFVGKSVNAQLLCSGTVLCGEDPEYYACDQACKLGPPPGTNAQCCLLRFNSVSTYPCIATNGVCQPTCLYPQNICSAGSTPAPPAPSGTPAPPGGWGSCGGCGPCGGPAAECISDPNGACVWDPSGCGNSGKKAGCNLCASTTNAYSGLPDPFGTCKATSQNTGCLKYNSQGVCTQPYLLSLQDQEVKTVFVYVKQTNGHPFRNWTEQDPNINTYPSGKIAYSWSWILNGQNWNSGTCNPGQQSNCPPNMVHSDMNCSFLNQTGSSSQKGGTWLCSYTIQRDNSSPATSSKIVDNEIYNYVQAKNNQYSDSECWAQVPIGVLLGTTAPTPIPTAPPTGAAWWQVVDGDVSSGGSLVSRVPAGLQFMIPPSATGFPGVASYINSYDFTADGNTTGSPSVKGWLAENTYLGKIYNSSYFATNQSTGTVFNTLPAGVAIDGATLASGGNVSPDGYFWYEIEGNATISTPVVITGTRKVVLVVNGGNLTIAGNITIQNPGQGTFIAEVAAQGGTGGGIAINPAVTTLNGIFLADGTTTTGTGAVALSVTGSFVSHGGITLQRDLGGALNATTPAEKFTYDPRLIFTIPNSLNISRIVWKEVAP